MKFVLVFALLAILHFKASQSILSGSKISITDAPYMVNIQEILNLKAGLAENCGGSIIKDRVGPNGKRVSKYILTAAHCAVNRKTNVKKGPNDFYITLGTGNRADLGTTGKFIQGVAKVYVHPEYKGDDTPHDIAILELKEDIELDGKYKGAIKLAGKDESFEVNTTEVLAAGWGYNPNVTSQNQLYRTTMKVRSYKECAQEYGGNPKNPITEKSLMEHQICALGSAPDYSNVCKGDSGGPLVKKSNGIQIGLVSFGQDCKTRGGYDYYNSVFTKIADNLDFIEKSTKGN